MSFIESLDAIGLEVSAYDCEKGWPEHLELELLVFLQFPDSKNLRSGLYANLKANCDSGSLPWRKPKRWAALYIGGERAPLDRSLRTTGYAISARVFSNWLTKSGNRPSRHISNWFETRGVSSAAPPEDGPTTSAATEAQHKKQNTKPTQKPVAPAAQVAGSTEDDKAWKDKARKRAGEIIVRQRAKDLYPNQMDIADEIAKEFRTASVLGASGKPMTGAYIKRHALTGISSDQGKQLSPSIRRSK
ncbi:MAG: hypothetical protein Q7T69_08155 [Rhodoferax sp.]|nr:hypothetical protein [Rhodoferax sp.]